MEDGVSGVITLTVQPHVEVEISTEPELVPTQLHLTEEMIAMELQRRLSHVTLITARVR